MDKNTAFLLRDGYSIAKLHDTQNGIAPECVRVTDENGCAKEFCVTSTRVTIIGRELPGGPLGDDFGIVCAQDLRSSKHKNTLGGGRLEPYENDFREEGDDTAEESVVECLIREVEEELGLVLDPDEVMLVGLRTITEDRSNELKTINGKVCADAYFIAFVDERLGAFRAHNGETGDRRVLTPEELLENSFHYGDERMLPQTQRLAVATALISIWDIFGKTLPQPVRNLVTRTLPLARSVYKTSHWAKNYIPIIQ